MATIVKRTIGDGATRYVVDFRDLNGRRRKERFKRERDARLRLAEVIAQREDGTLRAKADDVKLTKLVDQWRLDHWPHVRKNSRELYARLLDKHIVPALGERKLRTITLKDCEDLRRSVQQSVAGARGSGRASANLSLTLLKLLLNYAEKHGYVARNVARHAKPLPAPRKGEEEPILTPAELVRLWSAADGVWRAFLMTVAQTGLRKSEAMGLQWGDVDWASSTLHVRRQLLDGEFADPKSDYGRRRIAMTPELIATLKRWRLAAPKGPLDLVFPNAEGEPLDPYAVDRAFHAALRRAGLRRVTLHWLRHGYGSILISAGVSPKVVQTSMGHSSIKMTLDTYGHLMPGDHDAAASAMQRAFASNGDGHFLGTSGEKDAENRAPAEVSA